MDKYNYVLIKLVVYLFFVIKEHRSLIL